jgi:large subunit ribosomal protein L10
MATTEKISAVAELSEHFTSSSAAVITEYRGLTVKQVTELRRALGKDTTYAVVKNTLTKRAASDAGVTIDDSLLTGPTAIAFVSGDPVEAAKGLRDFARANPLLVIKGGLLDGKTLTVDEISRIADLESREVLLAKLAGALKALPTRAAALFQAPLSQMARLAKALEEKKPAQATVADDTVAAATVADDSTPAVVADDSAPAVVADDSAPTVVADDSAPAVGPDDSGATGGPEPVAVEIPSVEVTSQEAAQLQAGSNPSAEPAE